MHTMMSYESYEIIMCIYAMNSINVIAQDSPNSYTGYSWIDVGIKHNRKWCLRISGKSIFTVCLIT